jgi:copper(I)-binding protein
MKIIFTAFLLSISFSLLASSEIEINFPIIRLPPPGMEVTAMFLKIINHSEKDLKVIKVTGDFAQSFELHNMQMIDGKMKMRPVESIELKKKSTTELKSGGFHIMIFNLKKTLINGEFHKVKLTLDNKMEVEINARVEKVN